MMVVWRVLGPLAVLLAVVPAGRGQTYPLAEAVRPGDCFQVRLEMKLDGEIRIVKADKLVPLKLAATASHAFPERVLAVAANGTVEKTVRVYQTARAVITVVGEPPSGGVLRPTRRLVVAQRLKDQLLVYSPAGALSRDELDLTADHFDTLALPGLLPGKEVAVGANWEIPSSVAQALCHFEGLTRHTLKGRLEGVQGEVATLSVTGTAEGIDLGALVKLEIQATGRFDLKSKRLTALEWKQKDDRGQGPANPAAVVETRITLERKAIAQPAELSDVALVSVPDGEPPAPVVQLDYQDPQGRFSMLYSRDWHLVSRTSEHVVLRLMDRGDFIAQVTLTPWTPAPKGKHLTGEEFKAAMNDTSGWKPEKELQAGEVPSADGKWVYRLSELGQLDDLAVLQNFYLVAGPGGEQVVLAFTMTPRQADKLGARDLSLAGSIEVPAARK